MKGEYLAFTTAAKEREDPAETSQYSDSLRSLRSVAATSAFALRTMHSNATPNEFPRLRTGGLSFARISRQLGVSKPTLIAWSRQAQTDIHAAVLDSVRNDSVCDSDVSPLFSRCHGLSRLVTPRVTALSKKNLGKMRFVTTSRLFTPVRLPPGCSTPRPSASPRPPGTTPIDPNQSKH